MTTNIPEEGWPTIPVVRPGNSDPEFTGDVISKDNVESVEEFYRSILVPQLVCGPGDADPWPPRTWLTRDDVLLVGVWAYDDLYGVWAVREGAIYAPCVNPNHIAATFRALWDETTKHVDYLYGSSDNPLIMKFAEAAIRNTPRPTSPKLSEDGTRVEWRRDA